VVLVVGLGLAILAGTAAAVAAPSDSGRPWWHEGGPQHITGTVVAVDRQALTIDGLVSYEPVRGGIGLLDVVVEDGSTVEVGDTVDLDVTRHDGGWTAPSVTILDTD
jgi:hypothetical protein